MVVLERALKIGLSFLDPFLGCGCVHNEDEGSF
jgi:hypothetical protein